jgi:S-DNA-T family DNA segregation ATPase FtsK/SpoIIIE
MVELSPEASRGITGVILMILGGLIFLAFIGVAGKFGAFIHSSLRFIFGWPAYTLPIFLIGFGWALIKPIPEDVDSNVRLSTFSGAILFFLAVPALIHIFMPEAKAAEIAHEGLGGGLIGYGVSHLFMSLVDFWASLIILIGLMIVGIILVTNASMAQISHAFSIFVKGREEEGERVRISGEAEKPSFWKRLAGFFGFGKKEVEEPTTGIKTTTDSAWVFPSTDLLDDKIAKPSSGNIEKNVKVIKKTLEDFNIPVTMGDVNVGPTVTQFTLKPSTGVKLNQITARANDLALALAAHPIRIEAPIPGRSAAGIEVPNKVPALVRLRELLETKEYLSFKTKLSFMLGRDVAGKPVGVNLGGMPHLLIAGSTGSGKSICINNIIMTFLYRNSPADLKLILVDPKRVELVAYNGIPHLLTPVITDVDKTISALKWTIAEMERRYKVLQETGKRNIEVYNTNTKEKMPYIIVIVDELADLMAAAGREIEGSVVRLAQMARATGIHLIVATQRPSVDVITGLIKANITARIAFAVASQVDSRTILDLSGAEKLLGNGDMLYIASDTGKPKRIQGIFVADDEIKKVTDFLKKSGAPEYDEEILTFKPTRSSMLGEERTPDDELYEDAVEVVVQAKKASASLLQRRLRIGYARAARLLDLLEERGVVGPGEGAKPRDVLTDGGGRYDFEDH